MALARIVNPLTFTTPQEAEDAFYDALVRADLDAMMTVWSEEEEVVCVHPGALRVVGLAAVRHAWQQLFESGTRFHVSVSQPVAAGGTMIAIHNVLQHMQVDGDDELHSPIVATNVFMRGAVGWRMVAHHASPTPPRDDADSNGASRVVH